MQGASHSGSTTLFGNRARLKSSILTLCLLHVHDVDVTFVFLSLVLISDGRKLSI